ncbi:ATP-binding cassette domain-containing protein [Mesorhizobium sp. M0244]|uniref:ATP-binding cassette domain-containing protein n=1 Tax=Mesorhizobium sp. M0244 TaxID=2956926 RepID=UPI00333683C1
MTEIASKVREATAIVDIDHLLKRRLSQRSGGQRQRVTLARAMARASLFLMDEPTPNLDAKLRVAMRSWWRLTSGSMRGCSMSLMIKAMTMSARVALMKHGRVLQYASPKALYATPTHLEVATLIGQPSVNWLDPAGCGGEDRAPHCSRVALSAEEGLI